MWNNELSFIKIGAMTMPQKSPENNEEFDQEELVKALNNKSTKDEVSNLSRMLAAVLDYLSDDENEEIDIEYIFDKTEGLRDWWVQYQENNRKLIEEEIKESLSDLSFEELQRIREQIKMTELN